MSTQVLVTTGAGNVIKGGADIWTNHFLKEVWPNLPKRRSWLYLSLRLKSCSLKIYLLY